ncbi:MAG TPA: phytanoyl-CoA dioxygenase family protein, partial [Caldilineaceae bacterium]|nr:phytanoyl-CoA dioxygenase family protein [Caldilineaceae bacterium]
MTEKEMDYLFDLHGYLILRNAIGKEDLAEINQWVDDHWEYVENRPDEPSKQWIGNVELHSYGADDGVNFQNIIEGAPVFERLIDHPAWFPLAQKYINPANGISIHENFLNVRGPGGFLYIHCGGHTPLCYLTFRNHNTGEWMVGQINVLMALQDVGPGDGPTVLVPGSHKWGAYDHGHIPCDAATFAPQPDLAVSTPPAPPQAICCDLR